MTTSEEQLTPAQAEEWFEKDSAETRCIMSERDVGDPNLPGLRAMAKKPQIRASRIGRLDEKYRFKMAPPNNIPLLVPPYPPELQEFAEDI